MATVVIEKFGHRFWADFLLQSVTGYSAQDLKHLKNAAQGKPLKLPGMPEHQALSVAIAFENAGCTVDLLP
jgi:hypothetical protein